MVMPRIIDDEYPAAAGTEAKEGRRPTLVSAPATASPELSHRPRRRKFTAKEKLRILSEIDRAAGIPGAIGAIMRREGLYSSAITDWRRQREAGAYEGLSPPQAPGTSTSAGVSLSQGGGNGRTDTTLSATPTSTEDNQW